MLTARLALVTMAAALTLAVNCGSTAADPPVQKPDLRFYDFQVTPRVNTGVADELKRVIMLKFNNESNEYKLRYYTRATNYMISIDPVIAANSAAVQIRVVDEGGGSNIAAADKSRLVANAAFFAPSGIEFVFNDSYNFHPFFASFKIKLTPRQIPVGR